MTKLNFKKLLLLVLFSLQIHAQNDIFINGFEIQPSCEQTTVFTEGFNIPDQLTWPNSWLESGTSIELAEVINNEGRLIPLSSNLPYSLARIYHPLNNAIDVETTFSLVFENASSQGVGVYVRSNGGHLINTNPMGQGYVVFIERFSGNQSRLGLWYEHDGIESAFIREPEIAPGMFYDFLDGVKYNVRFQVFQEDVNNTRLRAKIWQDGTSEPIDWGVSVSDNYAPLQNISGSVAVDSFNSQSSGTITDAIRIDDIVIKTLCNPLLKISAPVVLENNFQFVEGPVWKDNFLLFSDIDANSIYQWNQPNGLLVFDANSSNANGLQLDNNNNILIAEHGNRQISIVDNMGKMTLVDNFQGDAFNSPNDIAVSTTGIVYFTDPDYGLGGRPREIAFNGVYRIHPQTGISVEYQGNASANKPNGIVLSKDQSSIFWSDTQTGSIQTMQVGVNGELTNQTEFANGLTIPDGMCVDEQGNIYVATWNSAVEVYSQAGDYWGAIALPENSITNCTFGGSNNHRLFYTGRTTLFQSSINN